MRVPPFLRATLFFALLLTAPAALSARVIEVTTATDAALRAAVAEAQDGDTVTIKVSALELNAPLALARSITLSADGADNHFIRGKFEGSLIEVRATGIAVAGLYLAGGPSTDCFSLGAALTVRDCVVVEFRSVSTAYPPADFEALQQPALRLERVRCNRNEGGPDPWSLDAVDCSFGWNRWYGAGGGHVHLERCVFEGNGGDGLSVQNGVVKDCVFRNNGDYGIRFDPDPGTIFVSGTLFHGNAGGGMLIRESAIATLENCTFTRHTGGNALTVTEADTVTLRHCTIADNVVLNGVEPATWPEFRADAALWIRSGIVTLENCLIADNPGSLSPHQAGIIGSWTDGGGNVIGGPALLAPLRHNGGPAMTLLPLPGSPALDAGRLSEVMRDARGLSRLEGTAPDAGAVEAGASAPADTDGDRLPDVWELVHALDPSDPADAAADADHDGMSALAEFAARTDPHDSTSLLRIESVWMSSEIYPPMLRWWTRGGVTYSVEFSPDLKTWQPSPRVIFDWHGEGQYIPANPWTPGKMGFYRLSARRE